MNVHQARGHIETGDIDCLSGERWINVRGHCGDAVIRNGNVHDCIDVVSRIDDTTARQQEVVALLRLHGSTGQSQYCDCEINPSHE